MSKKQNVMPNPKASATAVASATKDMKAGVKGLLADVKQAANPAKAEAVDPIAAQIADVTEVMSARIQAHQEKGLTYEQALDAIDSEDEEAKQKAHKAELRKKWAVSQKALQACFDAALAAAPEAVRNDPRLTITGYIDIDVLMGMRPFPINRDAEKRIRAVKNSHLHGEMLADQQKHFAVVQTIEKSTASFFDEELPLMLIDGHSRIAAIQKGYLKKPTNPLVKIDFHREADHDEIVRLYTVYTESKSVSTSGESTKTKNFLTGYDPESGFGKSASWRSAFQTIDGRSTKYEESVNTHKHKLELVDGWGFAEERTKTFKKDENGKYILPELDVRYLGRRQSVGIKAAILATYKTAKLKEKLDKWAEFWKDYLAQTIDDKGKPAFVAATISEVSQLHTWHDLPEHVGGSGSGHIDSVKKQAEKLFETFAGIEA